MIINIENVFVPLVEVILSIDVSSRTPGRQDARTLVFWYTSNVKQRRYSVHVSSRTPGRQDARTLVFSFKSNVKRRSNSVRQYCRGCEDDML